METGDYNINLLKIKTKKHFNDYFDELVTNGFFPKITLPTRIGDRSSSLIDNIFTNDTEEKDKIVYFRLKSIAYSYTIKI